MRTIRAWIYLAAFSCLLTPGASAQSPGTTAQPTRQSSANSKPPAARPKQPYRRDTQQFEARALTKPPDLPYMPPWPGQYKMLDSAVSPNAKGGPAFHVQFLSPDPPDQILSFYQQRLRQFQWTITKQNQMTLFATKDDNTVSLYVTASKVPKMKSNLLVLFSEGNKVHQGATQ